MSSVKRLGKWPDTGGFTVRDRFFCTCLHVRADHTRAVGYEVDGCERCDCRRFTIDPVPAGGHRPAGRSTGSFSARPTLPEERG